MKKYDWNLNEITNAVKESINFTEVLDKIGIPRRGNNTRTLKNILDTNNIDYSHFTGRARNYKNSYIKVSEYLNSGKKIKTHLLKIKLLKENVLENKCAICGLTEWQGKPITLQLHHINGNPNDNNLTNLQLLCPNCHSQTENYCGNANVQQIKYYCKDCGKEITKSATYCIVCSRKRTRKVKVRPDKEQLLMDFKQLKSIVQVGHKYNVTDNAIRKWFFSYDLPTKVRDLKKYILENKL
jgi:Zn finger protein HypA/HybF involved in hydrogenase expression